MGLPANSPQREHRNALQIHRGMNKAANSPATPLANSPQRFSAANSPRFEKPQLFRGFLLIEVKKQGRGRKEHQACHVGCGHLN